MIAVTGANGFIGSAISKYFLEQKYKVRLVIRSKNYKKTKQNINGNTSAVFINPLNSLRFVLNKIKKDKLNLNKNFYVFTGSSVGVVPIGKGLYTGKIDKLGSVKAIIR